MQYLELVSRAPEASWYRLSGDYQGEIKRWVVSTPTTVDICNRSELLGVEFSDALSDGLVAAVANAPFRPLLESVSSSRLCVLNFLRGSLNFDLRGVLHKALGSNHHASCFMSSQRYREEGRWRIREDMYRKLEMPRDAVLLLGDVVATGVTAANGLEVIEEHLLEHGRSLKAMVFFTIGCHKVEKLLERQHVRFKERMPGYEETHVIYLEGKFRLVDSSTGLMIGLPGTDLIKKDALLSPELEHSQYDSLSAPLERCVIYDAGSRAFDVREYLTDVIEYWSQVRLLARRGHILRDALKERWPENDYASRSYFLERKASLWKGVEASFVETLWDRYCERWEGRFGEWAGSRHALEEVTEQRLAELGRLRALIDDEDHRQ